MGISHFPVTYRDVTSFLMLITFLPGWFLFHIKKFSSAQIKVILTDGTLASPSLQISHFPVGQHPDVFFPTPNFPFSHLTEILLVESLTELRESVWKCSSSHPSSCETVPSAPTTERPDGTAKPLPGDMRGQGVGGGGAREELLQLHTVRMKPRREAAGVASSKDS